MNKKFDEETFESAEQVAAEKPAGGIGETTPAPESFDAPDQKTRLTGLFERLQIKKIVVVDDAVDLVLDAAMVDRIISEVAESTLSVSPFFVGIDLSAENNARFEQITAALEDMSAEKRDELGSILKKHHEDAADLGVGDAMRRLISDEMPIAFLTPQQWASQREVLLGETTEETRTLLLFDQQLNAEQKSSDIIGELSRTHTAAFGARWFCGILSHTLSRGDEIAAWRQLGSEENLELRFFMPIAKDVLEEAEAFYGAVYQTLINTYTERMKNVAREAFTNALEGALSKFAALNPLDFEHLIVKSSEIEGVSQLETLIRLHSLIHRDEVKTDVM